MNLQHGLIQVYRNPLLHLKRWLVYYFFVIGGNPSYAGRLKHWHASEQLIAVVEFLEKTLHTLRRETVDANQVLIELGEKEKALNMESQQDLFSAAVGISFLLATLLSIATSVIMRNGIPALLIWLLFAALANQLTKLGNYHQNLKKTLGVILAKAKLYEMLKLEPLPEISNREFEQPWKPKFSGVFLRDDGSDSIQYVRGTHEVLGVPSVFFLLRHGFGLKSSYASTISSVAFGAGDGPTLQGKAFSLVVPFANIEKLHIYSNHATGSVSTLQQPLSKAFNRVFHHHSISPKEHQPLFDDETKAKLLEFLNKHGHFELIIANNQLEIQREKPFIENLSNSLPPFNNVEQFLPALNDLKAPMCLNDALEIASLLASKVETEQVATRDFSFESSEISALVDLGKLEGSSAQGDQLKDEELSELSLSLMQSTLITSKGVRDASVKFSNDCARLYRPMRTRFWSLPIFGLAYKASSLGLLAIGSIQESLIDIAEEFGRATFLLLDARSWAQVACGMIIFLLLLFWWFGFRVLFQNPKLTVHGGSPNSKLPAGLYRKKPSKRRLVVEKSQMKAVVEYRSTRFAFFKKTHEAKVELLLNDSTRVEIIESCYWEASLASNLSTILEIPLIRKKQ